MPLGGLLLTGGASSRLGFTKAELRHDGERLVDRGARVLRAVCDDVLEVGTGFGSLPVVHEEPPGSGPLAAVAAGAAALHDRGHRGPVVVLAVDLPFVEPTLLAWLGTHPARGSVVPRVEGIAQSLCARYAPDALSAAQLLVGAGERSMRALLDRVEITFVDEAEWSDVCDERAFADLDTPEDLVRFGVDPAPRGDVPPSSSARWSD